MTRKFLKSKWWRRIAFFFPFQLLLVLLKKNQLIILFWVVLFGFVTQQAAAPYGIPFLFLNPEYFNQVSIWSHFIIGFACGGFIMAFNIASYVMNAFRFPFLATLANPFYKYCINNYIIPVAFLITYIINMYDFQINSQFATSLEAFSQIFGFLIGVASFVIITIVYFNRVNKDIFKMLGVENDEHKAHATEPVHKPSKVKRMFLRKNMQWKEIQLIRKESRDWQIETYMSHIFKIRLAREYSHYDKDMLIKVFKQNHANAALFEVFAFVSLLCLSFLRDIPLFEIPAGASLFLLFTMFLMLTSALHTWLRGWATTATIVLLVLLNFVYKFDLFSDGNRAYGLNYKTEKADFSYTTLKKFDQDKKMREEDIKHAIEMLNKWRLKNSKNSIANQKKPRLVIVNTSGGGLRSTLWTFSSLQYADSVLEGQLLPHIQLITGSSGGMVGAAYLRELYLRRQQKQLDNLYHPSFATNISNDVLNPMAFSIATTDLFLRLQSFKDGKYSYIKDRAYAFETKLNENTYGFMNKRLRDYREPEENAIIPMMVFSPTIINDSRKLIISSLPVSYLTQNDMQPNLSIQPLIENIEFTRFFKNQDADNLKFTSALRLSSTFPYIMPIVSLPSEPEMEVVDAGMRDNYGGETALHFLYTFRNWISSNTSGVVIIQIRDRYKEFPIEENPQKTMAATISQPIGSFYGNLFYMQDFGQNQLLQYASAWFEGKIDIIDFQLKNEKPDRISMSWHLTKKEKKKVLSSINLPENQDAIKKLKKLLE